MRDARNAVVVWARLSNSLAAFDALRCIALRPVSPTPSDVSNNSISFPAREPVN